jgi:hypothetical protein
LGIGGSEIDEITGGERHSRMGAGPVEGYVMQDGRFFIEMASLG